ncbi:unnamed protein product [Didymodactylos carnosus]|uniref:Uncharacterized protein n=1 Tax=Didymodactylos carnosus TaxID=1234261 RepID=A0A8S2FDN7_9BILA|nr:unnamed protein product [Didymodactylos carnosus]CAF4232004.1 unnamed protein product [Didymodactylos carnosus]
MLHFFILDARHDYKTFLLDKDKLIRLLDNKRREEEEDKLLESSATLAKSVDVTATISKKNIKHKKSSKSNCPSAAQPTSGPEPTLSITSRNYQNQKAEKLRLYQITMLHELVDNHLINIDDLLEIIVCMPDINQQYIDRYRQRYRRRFEIVNDLASVDKRVEVEKTQTVQLPEPLLIFVLEQQLKSDISAKDRGTPVLAIQLDQYKVLKLIEEYREFNEDLRNTNLYPLKNYVEQCEAIASADPYNRKEIQLKDNLEMMKDIDQLDTSIHATLINEYTNYVNRIFLSITPPVRVVRLTDILATKYAMNVYDFTSNLHAYSPESPQTLVQFALSLLRPHPLNRNRVITIILDEDPNPFRKYGLYQVAFLTGQDLRELHDYSYEM